MLYGARVRAVEVTLTAEGALTPTEIAAAWAAGATAVKVVPVSAVGDPGGDLDALAGQARRAVAAATGTAR